MAIPNPNKHAQRSDKEIIADVKMILNSMSKSMFAYNEDAHTIDFDIAIAAFSGAERELLIKTLNCFSNTTDIGTIMINTDNLALSLDHFYRTITDLKKVVKHGKIFYDIIVQYYIEKRFDNIEDAVDAIDGIRSRATFIRRANEACYQLYIIWYCNGPKYISKVLDELISL